MRRTTLVLTAVAVATAVLGCSAASPSPRSASGPAGQAAQTTQSQGASPSRISGLPAGAPLPPGLVTSIDEGPDHWSVLLVVHGSARQAQAAAVAFYVAHAFHRDSAYAVHNADYLISMVAESRDHSPTESNLTLVVERRH